MRRLTSLIFALTCFAVVPSPVTAQSADDRKLLQTLHDSLSRVTDTAALLTLETKTIDVAKKQRNDPMIHMRLGLIALRLRELGDKKHVDFAIGEFEWARDLQPEWPWPWLGIAMADRLSPDASRYAGGLFTLLKLDANSKATEALLNSLKVDSTFYEGLLGISEVAANSRINAPVGKALDALRSATSRSGTPDLLIARARLERLAGYPDSALGVFNRARLGGGPEALIWLEIARTLPLASVSTARYFGMPSTDSAYYLGALSDDSSVVSQYRSDLEPIVEDSIIVQFDAVHGQARANWLKTFWTKRDQIDLRSPGARLAEHFRRWDIVRRQFPLTPYRRRYAAGLETYKSGNHDIDDRGIILLRHGYPTQRVVWPFSPRRPGDTLARFTETAGDDSIIKLGGASAFLRPAVAGNYGNETWVYKRPDGDVVLHFAANFDPQDYRLQASGLGLDVAFYDILHASYGGVAIPTLRRLLESSAVNVNSTLQDERLRGKRDNATATTTDSWFREYPTTLSGRPGWFAAGQSNGKALVHLVYAVDARAISEQPWKQVPITVRAVFLDAAGNVVATLDTLELVNHPRAGATVVAIRAEAPLPPNAERVRLAVEITPDKGIVHRTDTLRIPRVDGSRVDISDILIGRPTISLTWRPNPADTAWLDPQMSYHVNDTLRVYTEAYDINTGEPYTVKLALTKQKAGLGKLLGGKSVAISLSETVVFGSNVARINRAVSLAALEPGDYQMEITVEGKNGKATSRRRVYIAN